MLYKADFTTRQSFWYRYTLDHVKFQSIWRLDLIGVASGELAFAQTLNIYYFEGLVDNGFTPKRTLQQR
jgi:hypothetical protein